MAVYPHPRSARVLVAYAWFGLIPTPRWFDDVDHELLFRHPRLGAVIWRVFMRLRSWGVIHLCYWGRLPLAPR